MLIYLGGVILAIGLLMTLVTQLELIKKLPYIVLNLLSLATVFLLAVSVIILIYLWRKLTKNFLFMILGYLSYEIYLIHAYAETVITHSFASILCSLFITMVFSLLLKVSMKRINESIK